MMKKLLLSFLLVPITVTALNRKHFMLRPQHHNYRDALISFDEEDRFFRNPDYLKFILGWDKRLDGHLYGVMTPAYAEIAVDKIHQNLISELKKGKSHFEAGKALAQKTGTADAKIVNTCATIEQRLREKEGKAGEITGKDPIVSWFASKTFDGQRFFENACPCDIYEKLTDEQLALLKQGTEETSK